MRSLNLNNIKATRKKPGHYKLYDGDHKLIYDGSSKNIEYRLSAVRYGRADYDQLPHKRELRKEAAFFEVEYMSTKKARDRDRKNKTKFGRY